MDHVGLGYRKDFGEEFFTTSGMKPAFVEVAPENWIDVGGFWKQQLDRIARDYPIYTHGLSLSIGSPDPLNWNHIKSVKKFLSDWNVPIYSEHLSYSQCSNAHLYDLLPIPFREDAVQHVSNRIKQVQDYLGQPLVLEIVSYYTPVSPEMSEVEFINAILDESGCKLLLDVNNVYVNAFNHNYDPKEFIDQLSLDRVRYIHMAGHEKVRDDLIIDTHGQAIIDPVYDLFQYSVKKLEKPVPVLLERDFNIPELSDLVGEMNQLERICQETWSHVESVK